MKKQYCDPTAEVVRFGPDSPILGPNDSMTETWPWEGGLDQDLDP